PRNGYADRRTLCALQQAARFVLAPAGLRHLASRLAELRIGVGDGEDLRAGGGTAQVGRRGVEPTPQLLATAASRLRPKLIWRSARCGAMGRPAKPGFLGLAAGIRLGVRCLGQGRQARAEARIRRSEWVRLERLAPARLSRTEC